MCSSDLGNYWTIPAPASRGRFLSEKHTFIGDLSTALVKNINKYNKHVVLTQQLEGHLHRKFLQYGKWPPRNYAALHQLCRTTSRHDPLHFRSMLEQCLEAPLWQGSMFEQPLGPPMFDISIKQNNKNFTNNCFSDLPE